MPVVNVTDFAGAVVELRKIAAAQFNAAATEVLYGARVGDPGDGGTPVAREGYKKDQAKLAKAQAEVSAAFKQLAEVDRTEKEHDGYADVVKLMKSTADAAGAVCLEIGVIMSKLPASSAAPELGFESHQLAQLDRLKGVLDALAALSPAALWTPAPVAAAAK